MAHAGSGRRGGLEDAVIIYNKPVAEVSQDELDRLRAELTKANADIETLKLCTRENLLAATPDGVVFLASECDRLRAELAASQKRVRELEADLARNLLNQRLPALDSLRALGDVSAKFLGRDARIVELEGFVRDRDSLRIQVEKSARQVSELRRDSSSLGTELSETQDALEKSDKCEREQRTRADTAEAQVAERDARIAELERGLVRIARHRFEFEEEDIDSGLSLVAEIDRRIGNLQASHEFPRVQDVAQIHELRTRADTAEREFARVKDEALYDLLNARKERDAAELRAQTAADQAEETQDSHAELQCDLLQAQRDLADARKVIERVREHCARAHVVDSWAVRALLAPPTTEET